MSEISDDATVAERQGASSPLISVVMVTYNSLAVLPDSLGTIERSPELQFIVVDNNSTDGTAEYVRRKFPYVELVQNKDNLGFAKAINIGAQRATGSTVVLLNPDATISLPDLTGLHRQLVDSPDIAVVAPLLDHPGRDLSVREAGMKPSLWRAICHYYGLSRVFSGSHWFDGMYLLRKKEFHSVDVDWVSGACMAVPRSVWVAANGLSERWFMYAEDVEFCLRQKKRGGRVVVTESSKGVHGLGRSSSSTDDRPSAVWLINLYDLYKSEISSSRLQNVMWKLVLASGMFARAGGHALRATAKRQWFMADPNYMRFRFYGHAILRASSGEGVPRELN